MSEREPDVTTRAQPSRSRFAPEPFPNRDAAPVTPTIAVSSGESSVSQTLRASFDEPLRRLERLQRQLPLPAQPYANEAIPTPSRPPNSRSTCGILLQATLAYLEQVQNPPLLPAPPTFEDAFAPVEPMFHTVFFRKYPYHLQADAKQEALLRLWLQWRQDMTLLEQTPAFIVQAALWGASPFGKKRAKIDKRECPLPQHERYWEEHAPQTSRDPAWIQRLDLQIDVQHAVQRVRERIAQADEAVERLTVLEHVVVGKAKVQGRRESGLSIRIYQHHRAWVEQALREELADYRPE